MLPNFLLKGSQQHIAWNPKKNKISTVQLNNLQNWVGDYYYYYRYFLAIAP
jgi:hypothetical protein